MLMSASIGLMTGIYRLTRPNATDRQQLIVSKMLVFIIIVIAFIFTITGGEALAILNIMSYGLITQLVPALLFGFFDTKLMNKFGAMAGIVVGVSIVLYNAITDIKLIDIFYNIPSYLNDLNTGMIALIANFIIGITISLVTNTKITPSERVIIQNKKEAIR